MFDGHHFGLSCMILSASQKLSKGMHESIYLPMDEFDVSNSCVSYFR
jgi:hypothetical protein